MTSAQASAIASRPHASAPHAGHPAQVFYSPPEVAARLGCPLGKVKLMLACSALPGAIKFGRYWRIALDESRLNPS